VQELSQGEGVSIFPETLASLFFAAGRIGNDFPLPITHPSTEAAEAHQPHTQHGIVGSPHLHGQR